MNNFDTYVVKPLQNSISANQHKNAFYIDETFYTYKELGQQISKIQGALSSIESSIPYIGLVLNNDLETYASIFALWLEGKAYVPLHPEQPIERNDEIISQVDITTILDSSEDSLFSKYHIIDTKETFTNTSVIPVSSHLSDDEKAYILFTSGSTGKPKGVPITKDNLAGFVNAFWKLGIDLTSNDRCLQMFELTFDLSVMSYLVPLLKGACVYTIPKDQMKFAYIAELMEDHELTFSLMVPSILNYLRPYFNEMEFPKMRYSLFCGEALPLDITQEWSSILPNAMILNLYGPTEDTIFCTSYEFKRNSVNKSYNGVLSVGKQMHGTQIVTVNKENTILNTNEKGELCLSGVQLTPGYWKNDKKNRETFFTAVYNGVRTRFYRTGDICVIDEEKDILYIGRLDSQTQVQGFRVELSEIEFYTRNFLEKVNIAVIAFENQLGNTEVGLVIEGAYFSDKELLTYLKTKLPHYMIPTVIKFVEKFPENMSGKTDKKALKLLF